MADGGRRDLLALHVRDVDGGQRLVAHRERAQGADPQRMGETRKARASSASVCEL